MFQTKNNQNRSLVRLLFCFFILFNFILKSQVNTNLVNNPSAEQIITCPYNVGQAYRATYWYLPTGLNGSTDYFNICATATNVSEPLNYVGFQNPRTGNAYFGFVTYGKVQSPTVDYREYLGNGLNRTMRNNKTYCITYYVSLAEISRYATANIGVIFSQDSILNITSVPVQPLILNPDFENTTIITDTINWARIQGTYLANGTERFMTIGNFRTDMATSNTQVKPLNLPPSSVCAYYYIDDISVIEINNANAFIKDSISKCALDSILLGTDSTEFATYQWQSTTAGLAALSCTDCANPFAKPNITTKYYLTKVQCSSTTKDSVMVVVLTPTTQANAGNDKSICIGDYVQIGTQDSSAFTNYSWQFNGLSCINCAQPYVNPTVSTTYTVQRTECTNVTTDTVRVIVDDCDPTFILPNVFTPNGDGINDTWSINFSTVNAHITNFKMNIYDRWGLLVYESNSEQSSPKSKWDGHTTSGIECSSGVYYYIITFEKNEEHVLLKGNLSLYR